HLRKAFRQEMAFQLDAKILAGTGAGVPEGIINAPATITVSKETGQAAATITIDNISKMWSRLPAPSRRRAAWFVHEDVEAQLDQLALLIGTAGSASNVFLPAGVAGNQVP